MFLGHKWSEDILRVMVEEKSKEVVYPLDGFEKCCVGRQRNTNLKSVYLRSSSSCSQWVSMRDWCSRISHSVILTHLVFLVNAKHTKQLSFYYKATVVHKHRTEQISGIFFFLIRRSVLHEREALQSTLKSYLKSISKTNSNVQGEKCKSKTKTKKAFEVLCMFLNRYRKIRLEQENRN